MAEPVQKWRSDDGKVYDTELEALKADVAYWKKYGRLWLEKEEVEKSRRMPYHERGSHQ